MIITAAIAFVLGTIILSINRNNISLRWVIASLYAVCLSSLTYYLDEEMVITSDVLVNSMNFIADAAMSYCFGMFGVSYSGILNKRNTQRMMVGGAALVVLVWLLTPLSPTRHINYSAMHGWPMYIFVDVSLLTGASMLIVAYYKEKHPFKKIERILTSCLVVPIMIWICLSYMVSLVGFDLWQYNYVAAIVFLFMFVVLGVKYGVLGVKFKVEQLKTGASRHALLSSTSVINHTIKNEIGKIDIILHHLRSKIKDDSSIGVESTVYLENILTAADDSIQHIQSMMSKIHESIQAIEVSPQKGSLQNVAEECLRLLERTKGKEILWKKNYAPVADCYFDKVHMKEVMNNVLNNALEAIDQRGEITVSIFETKKDVVVRIQDTGKGIGKEVISSIFNPFFSTKLYNNNYGLGLFYCHNVMMQHGGSIHVESKEGSGTVFSLSLPK